MHAIYVMKRLVRLTAGGGRAEALQGRWQESLSAEHYSELRLLFLHGSDLEPSAAVYGKIKQAHARIR